MDCQISVSGNRNDGGEIIYIKSMAWEICFFNRRAQAVAGNIQSLGFLPPPS